MLVGDDFAVKYTEKEDAQHLNDAIQKDYTITVNWDTTIDTLFQIGTALDEPNGRCAYKLFLIFGEPSPTWRPPLPCLSN